MPIPIPALTRFDRLGNHITITRTDRITGTQRTRDYTNTTDILALLELAYIYGVLDTGESLGAMFNQTVNAANLEVERLIDELIGPK